MSEEGHCAFCWLMVANKVIGRRDFTGTSFFRDHLQNCSGLALEGRLSLCTALCVALENCAFCAHCVGMFFTVNRAWVVIQTDVKIWQNGLKLNTSGHYMYHQFNIQQFYVLPTQCIYVFCVDLRTNSDYFPIQH
jgi:hypothetical protein